MRKILTAVAALAAVGFVFLGWPWLLFRAATGPLIPYLPDLSQPAFVLAHPESSGLLIGTILVLAGAAWLVTATALAVEIVAQARGRQAPQLGALFPQGAMAKVASAIVIVLPATQLAVPGPATAAPEVTHSSALAGASESGVAMGRTGESTGLDAGATRDQHGARSPSARGRTYREYRVKPGDTLWAIAGRILGDPERYPELYAASRGFRQADGNYLRDPDHLEPGWVLRIPERSRPRATPNGSAEGRRSADADPAGTPEPRTDDPRPSLDRGSSAPATASDDPDPRSAERNERPSGDGVDASEDATADLPALDRAAPAPDRAAPDTHDPDGHTPDPHTPDANGLDRGTNSTPAPTEPPDINRGASDRSALPADTETSKRHSTSRSQQDSQAGSPAPSTADPVDSGAVPASPSPGTSQASTDARPRGLRVDLATVSGAQLVWSPPDRGDVVGYRLTVNDKSRILHSEAAHLRGLTPGTQYEVTLVAITPTGPGQPVSLHFTTPHPAPVTPMHVAEQAHSATSGPQEQTVTEASAMAISLASLGRTSTTRTGVLARAAQAPRPSRQGVAAFAVSLGLHPAGPTDGGL